MCREQVPLLLNKINGKVKFCYKKNNFFTPKLRKMLCKAFSNCANPAWYPNLSKQTKGEYTIYER